MLVAGPTQSVRGKWNEFPEEAVIEKEQAPRVKTQDWVPQNEVEHPVAKTQYRPGRIARQWPPPENEREQSDM